MCPHPDCRYGGGGWQVLALSFCGDSAWPHAETLIQADSLAQEQALESVSKGMWACQRAGEEEHQQGSKRTQRREIED